jgi:hypothetical protein
VGRNEEGGVGRKGVGSAGRKEEGGVREEGIGNVRLKGGDIREKEYMQCGEERGRRVRTG